MIKQLIFDCDGVLVDSEILAAQVMLEILSKYGIDISLDFYLHNCTGKTFSGSKTELSKKLNTPLPNSFLEEVTIAMDIKIKNELKPISGIHNVLENTDLPKAVVSNSDMYQIEHAIDHINITDHFNGHIFSSQMVEKPKPDPDVYLFAAKELAVHPKECLVVEDSISGATAALKAGMNVIGFVAGSHIIDGHEQKLINLGVSAVAKNAEELLSKLLQY
ncbi:MAG: HAD family hydrolase [Cyclobacteriaceae bacterium]|nr:HAD family hydrolase [Cyclobacteriaceae bacterium]